MYMDYLQKSHVENNIEDYSAREWKTMWQSLKIVNKELFEDCSEAVTSFNIPKKL